MKTGRNLLMLLSGGISLGLALYAAGQERQKTEERTPPRKYCERRHFENKPYIVCHANPAEDDIRLFLRDITGRPYTYFRNVIKALDARGETLAFAMNAGMYHKDYSTVGLYIENGEIYSPVSTRDGRGNFYMKPNGIFYISRGRAGVADTQTYLKSAIKADLATQSGPMLVIDNKVHQRFIPASPCLEYRNGVGVTPEGDVIFVLSEKRVNFDELARFFRDGLKTPNALYLDGSISSLYAPELRRADRFYPLGPMIGVVVAR